MIWTASFYGIGWYNTSLQLRDISSIRPKLAGFLLSHDDVIKLKYFPSYWPCDAGHLLSRSLWRHYNDQTGWAWSMDWGLTNNFATLVTKLLCHVGWPISVTWHKFLKCMDNTVDWVSLHNDVIEWKHFPCYCPFVRRMHRSPVDYPHKGRWRGALMFSLMICPNTRLSKQSGCRWFEMPSCSLWCHCDVVDPCSMDQVDPVWWNRNMGPSLGKTVLLLVLQLPMYLNISHAFCLRNKMWVKLLYEISAVSPLCFTNIMG